MKGDASKILIIGIGNQGRADDGLGWAFIDYMKDRLPEDFDFEYRYQLQIEDAELLSHYAEVHFVDADKESSEQGFRYTRCMPDAAHGFSTHALEPETVLYLTNSIYQKFPNAHVLGITGYSFELEMGISDKARENLARAMDFFCEKMIHLIN